MGTPIEGGAVSSFFKMLDSMFKSAFKNLENDGLKTSEHRELKDNEGNVNGLSFTCLSENNHMLHVKALKSAGRTDLYDIYIVGDNGAKKKYIHQTQKDLEKCIVSFLRDNYDDYEGPDRVDLDLAETIEDSQALDVDSGEFEAAKKLQISLSKIEASGEIQHGAIYCNYDELEAYQDLENILDDDIFVNTLTEEPQNFEIIPNEDDYSVDVISDILPMDCSGAIIKAQITALLQLYALLRPESFDIIFNPMRYISAIRWQLDCMLDNFMFDNTRSNNLSIQSIIQSIKLDEIGNQTDGNDIVESYATVLDMYYGNYPHEIQKMFDDWLLSLRYDKY